MLEVFMIKKLGNKHKCEYDKRYQIRIEICFKVFNSKVSI